MILEKKTEEKFGYLASELSAGSKKQVLVICDYCKKEYEAVNRNVLNGREFVKKDCCWECRHKKVKDVNVAKYGVENQFQRQIVKDKIVDNNINKYNNEYYTQTQEFKDKSRKTNLEKYGVENANQSKTVRDKISNTNLERYGNKCSMNSEEIRLKIESDNLEKYGVKNYLQSEEGKKKIAQTNFEKYGAANPFSDKDIQEQIRKTNLEKLGVEYPTQSEIVREKSRKTCLDKYGVEFVSQNDTIKEQIRKTNIERYGHPTPIQNKNIFSKMIKARIKSGNILTFNGKTIKEIAKEHSKSYHSFRANVYKYGIDYALSIEPKENGLEKLFKDMLDKNNISYSRHLVVNKRNTDFVLSNGTIVECNGNYWHSDQVIKDKRYHSTKQKDYTEVNRRSFFFREDEIENKLQIIESIVLNHLGKSNRIYARLCAIKPVPKLDAKQFLIENHLMGPGSGKSFGLFFNDKLISLIQIRCKNIENKIYEISRFCTVLNTTVIGGFSKLLKFTENTIDMSELFTFIDLRYGTGEYLPKLGFKENKTFLSFKWVNHTEVLGRMKFPGDSGYKFGYAKVWDCGQKKFTKTY